MGFTFEEFPNADLYRSDLRKILRYVRSIEKYIAEFEEVIEELKEGIKDIAYLKQCCEEVQAQLILINNNLNALNEQSEDYEYRISVLEVQYAGFKEYVDNLFNEMKAIHNEDFNLLLYKLNQSKAQLEAEIDYLRWKIEQIDTSVYNPWLAKRVEPQENEDFIFNHLADECPTADEYAGLGLTAAEYASKQLTSRDYQEFGKTRLHFWWVFSPAFGWKQEINNVLTSIVDFVCNTLSSDDYANLQLTADEYAALDLSASDYYKYNPYAQTGYIEVNPLGIGLTVDQYHHLQTV
jgi:hypothetical protein